MFDGAYLDWHRGVTKPLRSPKSGTNSLLLYACTQNQFKWVEKRKPYKFKMKQLKSPEQARQVFTHLSKFSVVVPAGVKKSNPLKVFLC